MLLVLLVEELHQLRDAERIDAHPQQAGLVLEGLVQGAGHPDGHHPLGLALARAILLAAAQGVEHLPNPGVLGGALEPDQRLGIAERPPHDPVDPEHLPEKDHPLGIHGVEPLRDLEHGGGGMGLGLGG
ncbi:MAG: hypothetical protein ACKOCX_05850 [Planctomycetota bacterium]